MKKGLLIIVGLLLATQVGMAKYSAKAKILDIYAYGADNAVIKLNINVADVGCSYKNAMVIPNYTTTNKGIYSSILSAFMAGKPVHIGYTPGNCSDLWGANSLNKIYSILLKSN